MPLPFTQEQPYIYAGTQRQETSDLLDVAEQLVDGFISGFTTFETGDAPKDEWGQMARGLGHLAGFIGFIPGMGTLGGLASKGLMAATGFKILKGTATATKISALAPKIGQFKSIPMLGADLIAEGLTKAGAGNATKLAADFLIGKGLTRPTVEGIQYALEGGLHLGAASGISTWQHGIDAMTDSFIQGAIAGGVFRGLGQVLPNAPGRAPMGNVVQNFKQILIDPKTGQLSPDGNGMLRVLASSMFTGLPATLQGQSTPLQVYEYLLGAVFGAGEMSKPDKEAHTWITKEAFKAVDGTNLPIQMGHMQLLHPENVPSFNELTPKVKEIVKANLLLRGFGIKNLQFQLGGEQYETETSVGGLEFAKLLSQALPKTFETLQLAHADKVITNEQYTEQLGKLQTAIGSAKLNKYYSNIIKGMKGYNARMSLGELTEAQKADAWDRTTKRVSDEILETIMIKKTGSVDAPYNLERRLYETVESKVHTEYTEIMNEIKEKSPSFTNPAETIGNEYYREAVRRQHTEPSQTSRVEHVIKVAKVINNVLSGESVTFNKLKIAVEKEVGFEISKPTIKNGFIKDSYLYRELVRAYKYSLRTHVPTTELAFSDNGKRFAVVEAGNVNSKNQIIAQSKHRHWIKELFGKDFYFSNLKQIKWQGTDYDLHDVKDTIFSEDIKNNTFKRIKEVTPAEIIYRIYQDPNFKGERTLFVGAKDNSNMFVVSFVDGAKNKEQADATLVETYRIIKESEGQEAADAFRASLDKRVANFITSSRQAHKGSSATNLANVIFRQQYANNLLMLAKMNGMSLEEYLIKSRDPKNNFIKNGIALNKRGSLFNNGFDRLDPEYFTDVEDIIMSYGTDGKKTGNLKIAFIKNIHSSGQNTKGQNEPKKYKYGKNNEVEEVDYLAHVDGYFKLRDDIYERLSLQAGLELETGSQKGTLVHVAEDGQGLIIGKYAYHKASKNESNSMRTKGIHGLMPESAAKQIGTREFADAQWNKDTKEWSIEGKTYDIPIDAFTTTEAGEHASLTLKDKAILSQMMSGLQSGKHNRARKELTDIVNNAFKGVEAEDNKAKQHLSNPASIDSKKINIEELSSQTLLDILYSGKNTPLLQDVLSKISKVIANRDYEEDIFNAADKQAEIDVREGHKRTAEELMVLWDGMLTPAMINHKLISKYFNNAVKYYLINRTVTPKVPGSFDSILQPYFGEITGLIDLKPGEIILSKRHAEIEIPWLNNTTKKAKEAFEEYQKETNPALKQEMEENLSWVFQRVPTDSPSGIRVLKIKGFQDIEGSGVVMHPEDMENIGGADLDIDKVYGFTRFSKAFKDDIRSTMYEWYEDAIYTPKSTDIPEPPLVVWDYKEIIKQPTGRIMRVGIKEDDDIFIGRETDTHADLATRLGETKNFRENGFIDENGKFLTRKEASEATKIREGVGPPEQLDSYTLFGDPWARYRGRSVEHWTERVYTLNRYIDELTALMAREQKTYEISDPDAEYYEPPTETVTRDVLTKRLSDAVKDRDISLTMIEKLEKLEAVPYINTRKPYIIEGDAEPVVTQPPKKVRILKDSKDNKYFLKETKDAKEKVQGQEEIAYTKVKSIPRGEGRTKAVAARRLANGEILVNESLLKRKFTQKAWTKPAVEGVEALPVDAFKSYEEWKQFVLRHESMHATIKKKEGEATFEYENRVNRAALNYKPELSVSPGKSYWDMFDAVSMYEVNETATRGNRLLSPGIGATKIMEGVADYLLHSKRTLVTQDGVSKQLSYADLDLPTFRAAKRALINRAADAADGEQLKNPREVVEELWSILTKGQGGSYSKAREANPIIQFYTTLNSAKNGAGIELTKSEHGIAVSPNNNALGTLSNHLFETARAANINEQYIQNPYFQSLYSLSKLSFKRYKSLPFISADFVEQAKKISLELRKDPNLHILLGVQKGSGTPDDPFGWKAFNDIKLTPTYKKIYAKSPEQARQFETEIFSQDASDLNSALLLRHYAPKDYDADVIASIHKKVDSFKKLINEAVKDAKDNLTDYNFSNIEVTLARVDKLRRQYAEDLPEKYRDFFHAATVSSLTYQGQTLGDFLKTFRQEQYAKYRQTIKDIKAKEPNPWTQSYLRKEARIKFLNTIRDLEAEGKREWQKTNISDLPFRLNSIPSYIKLKFGEFYNQTVQKLNAEVPDDKLLEMEGYTSNKYITAELQYPSSERVSSDFLKLSTLIAKETSGDVPIALQKQLQAIGPKFTEALANNPWYIPHLDTMFSGFMDKKAGGNAYGFLKTPEMSSVEDVIDFANSIIKIHENKGKPLPIKRQHWFRNRKHVAQELEAYEGRFQQKIRLVQTPEKKGAAEVLVLESSLGSIGEVHNFAQIHGSAQEAIIDKNFQASWGDRLIRALNKTAPGFGDKLYDLAMDEHQGPLGNKSLPRIESELEKALRDLNSPEQPTVFTYEDKTEYTLKDVAADKLTAEQRALLNTAISSVTTRFTDAYKTRLEKTALEIAEFRKDKKKYHIPFLNKKMTAGELIDAIRQDEKQWASRVLHEAVSNSQKTEQFLAEHRAPGEEILDTYGYIQSPRLAEALYKYMSLGKPENMSIDLIDRIRHQLMLENITLNPMSFFRRVLKDQGITLSTDITYGELVKDPVYRKLVGDYEKKGFVEGLNKYSNTMFGIYKDMIKNNDFNKQVKSLPSRELMSQTWDYLKDFPINVDNWIEYKPLHARLPDWYKDHYHPHMTFNQKSLTRQLFKKIVRAMSGESPDASQAAVIAGQFKEEHLAEVRAREEHNITEPEKIIELANMADGITETNVKDLLLTFTSALERSRTEPLEEWQNKITNRYLYEKSASKNYWAGISAFIGDHLANKFNESGTLGSTTTYWTKYLKTFNQQMVNGNSLLPLINRGDPNMGLKYNPYILFTDKYWEEKVKYIEKKMFNGAKLFRDYTDLTDAQIKEITSNPEKMAIAQDLYFNDVSTKLAMISNLEAKYELLTLLSHPKTYVNNMIGGNLNTVSNIGMDHFKHAMDIKYLRENVFLNFNSRDDVLTFVEKMGGIEAMFASQFGLDPVFKSHKLKQAFGTVVDYFKKGNQYSEKTVREMLKEAGVGEAALNTAGWFMKESEVRLRSRAWMAHYLNVRQTLEASGLTLPEDHPWLIQWANKGVEATQYLYNNANRAPFARTHLGKVFSRFQLWAWNSLAFRRDVMAQAHEAGWEEGSAEFKRMQRLITADVFIFALAKAFAMSTFDNTLPPPLSYLSDFGQFFFGDDDEKKKAFYGGLPYPANVVGVIAPPLSRIPFNIISSLADGSLEELSARITSWFPFGRIAQSAARTVRKPENLLQNFTGFPLDKLSGYREKIGEFEPRGYMWQANSDTSEVLKKSEKN